MHEFPDLPIITQAVNIRLLDNHQVDILLDGTIIQSLIETAEAILAIPKWEASHIFEIKCVDIPKTNQLYLIVRNPRHFREDFGYIMYKDEELYEMVYYRINESLLQGILEQLPM